NGEIISADSRQVYKGMDIGTGKDIDIYKKANIKVWGLDLVNPDYQFNLGEYKKFAQQVIKDIWQRGKLPIVVGGTGLYIKSLLEPMEYVKIPPDAKLRKILGYYDITRLRTELEKLDKDRLKKMNNSDRNNPRRLIRAIEIATYLRHVRNYSSNEVRSLKDSSRLSVSNNNNTLLVGLTTDKKILFKKISERIKKRLKQGIVQEIKTLLNKGYDWKLPSMLGLGYQEFKPYFEKKESLSEVIKKWQIDEQNYVQRQLVWFRKMSEINWFDISQPGFYTEVEKLVCNFLQKS
ncbi:tRNA (adenosine(37)-N6)-dimethylallyltransferase MiaA, partial [Candidatus Roizmanbacteria bacterium]|nr:tRNA (adenosine(37)-N6)-dimethylallyltransferase MiaA [Candidatus Roizmanbacteria bacterium]